MCSRQLFPQQESAVVRIIQCHQTACFHARSHPGRRRQTATLPLPDHTTNCSIVSSEVRSPASGACGSRSRNRNGQSCRAHDHQGREIASQRRTKQRSPGSARCCVARLSRSFTRRTAASPRGNTTSRRTGGTTRGRLERLIRRQIGLRPNKAITMLRVQDRVNPPHRIAKVEPVRRGNDSGQSAAELRPANLPHRSPAPNSRVGATSSQAGRKLEVT